MIFSIGRMQSLFVFLALTVSGVASAAQFQDLTQLTHPGIVQVAQTFQQLEARLSIEPYTLTQFSVRVAERADAEEWANIVLEAVYRARAGTDFANAPNEASCFGVRPEPLDITNAANWLTDEIVEVIAAEREVSAELVSLRLEFAQQLNDAFLSDDTRLYRGSDSRGFGNCDWMAVADTALGEIWVASSCYSEWE